MKRLPDWRTRLTAYVVDTAHDPFVPGKTDCALWAAGAVEAMTGEDLARGFRGYRTIAGGWKKLKAKGFVDHVALLASVLEEIPPAFAQVGDVAVVAGEDGPALGIVQGELIYVSAPAGRSLLPLSHARRAFRVPFEDR